MYSLIGVLYALRQPDRMTGLVDGTLVFGTPVIVSGLLMVIFSEAEYGVAIISAGLGLYYVMLARYTWNRVDPALKLLAEALLAIGTVFATLAIPYTLEGHWSSASWALEAAGILWVALRQQRLYAQLFAIALQFGAGLLFLVTVADEVTAGIYAGGTVIAAGALISARLLYLLSSQYRLRVLHSVFFVWGLLWWLWSAATAIEYFDLSRRPSMLLVLVATACTFVVLDRVRAWDWRPASITAIGLLPMLILFAFEYVGRFGHVLRYPDSLAWGVAVIACYWVICQLESVPWRQSITLASHTGYVLFLSSLLSVELYWGLAYFVEAKGEGFAALVALCPLAAFRLAYLSYLPAQRRLGDPLRQSLLMTLGAVLAVWSVSSNVGNTGAVDPLPYLPFLNPVDLLQFLFFSFAAVCLLGSKRIAVAYVQQLKILLGGLIFIWLTFVLLRSLHHYLDIPYRAHSMLRDVRVHMCLSILWTVMGMAIMLIASKRFGRGVWLVGASLVTVVLAKMFFVDLAASGTVERIVTCLVVGGLLMTTGYFAPAPARKV
jgi:uncharacterized membrane protein